MLVEKNGIKLNLMETKTCSICDGTGFVEETISYRDEPNLPIMVEGTGKMLRCPECNTEDDFSGVDNKDR